MQSALTTPTASTIPISSGSSLRSSCWIAVDDVAGQPREGERARLRDEARARSRRRASPGRARGSRSRRQKVALLRGVSPVSPSSQPTQPRRSGGRSRVRARAAARVGAELLRGPRRARRSRRSAAALAASARLLDVHADPDHNRSVFTLVGDEARARRGARSRASSVARERIDLRRHAGAHPRIGAADVVPIVPIDPGDLDRARGAALALGARIGALGLPVFLYAPPERGPAFYRRGGSDGAAAPARRGRARARLRPGAARPVRRRRHRRRPARR